MVKQDSKDSIENLEKYNVVPVENETIRLDNDTKRAYTGTEMLRHKLIRFLEQPSVIKDKLYGIMPWHARSCVLAGQFIGEAPKTILDIGSNVGNFTKAAKFYFPNAKIFQFDLMTNTGLWNKNTKLKFNRSLHNSGQNTLLKPSHFKPVDMVETDVKRFDNLNIPIERPCFAKLDVEGAEYQVLEGFGNKLKEVDVLQIEEVFSDYFEKRVGLGKIIELLRKHGFKGFQQINIAIENNKLEKCDLLFFK